MYLITTRPIEDALNDCRILNKRGVNATASPSMKIERKIQILILILTEYFLLVDMLLI